MTPPLRSVGFLPYAPEADAFPGAGRGMVAWQRDGVGHGQESVTLIAHDADGLSEAVGTFYEAVAGLDPLTKWALPDKDSLTAAKIAPGRVRSAFGGRLAVMPDRVDAIKVENDALTVLSHDGTLMTVSAKGKVTNTKFVAPADVDALRKELTVEDKAAEAAAKAQARPDRMLKLAAARGRWLAVAYWGGTVRIVEDGKVRTEQLLPQDVTALAWRFDGGELVVGLADGRVMTLRVEYP